VYRSKRLVVRLDANEQRAILRLAKAERLPASTLARRLLLQEADRRGLCLAGQKADEEKEHA